MKGKTSAAAFRATSPSLGESVFALGFPYSGVLGAGINFTSGNISSLSGIRNDSRYVQFTAPVQSGNSGGPLVDNNGLVVGVVSARLPDIEILKATGSLPQNVNFAIRGELATGFLKANGFEPLVAEPKTPLSASEIAHNAEAYTVQVICQQRRGEASSGDGGYQVVGVDYNDVLKVRQWPSPNSRIVAILAPGTTGIAIIRYRMFPNKDTWAFIRYAGHEGWVNSRYLSP